MWPGMMPILAWPGVMMPGQFGPMRRDGIAPDMSARAFDFRRKSWARIMSFTGMPSVMQMTNSMPASADSMIASAANGGGTKISEQFAPSFWRASRTLLKTAKPSCVVPPLPGVTPPTTCVP